MVAAAIVGGAIVGGAVSSRSAADASDAQSDAAEAGISEQRLARASFEQRSQPFVDIGTEASGALMSFLGMTENPELADIDRQIASLRSNLNAVSVAPFPGVINGESFDEMQASDPFINNDRADSINAQIQSLQDQRDNTPEFLEGDRLGQLEEINPLVSFLRDQGFEDIQESAAASGRLGAGGTLKDLTQFNTDLTSTIVPQLQNQRFNQLFNTVGLGANAAAGVGTAGLATASNIGNLLSQSGQAQAQGIIGQSNALTGTIQNLSGAAGAFGETGNQQPNALEFPMQPATTTQTPTTSFV